MQDRTSDREGQSQGRKAGRKLEEAARAQAEEERARVSPERLSQAISEYINWQALAFWVRAMTEAATPPPTFVTETLRNRCPDFLQYEQQRPQQHPNEVPCLWLRLLDWVHANVFEHARREGWFHAVGYYALRDPRWRRISQFWEHCEATWSQRPPAAYPRLEEWLELADGFSQQESEERDLIC